MEETSTTKHRAVLATTAALSSALGSDDTTSLQRAVAAASGMAADLDPPSCLEELDVE